MIIVRWSSHAIDDEAFGGLGSSSVAVVHMLPALDAIKALASNLQELAGYTQRMYTMMRALEKMSKEEQQGSAVSTGERIAFDDLRISTSILRHRLLLHAGALRALEDRLLAASEGGVDRRGRAAKMATPAWAGPALSPPCPPPLPSPAAGLSLHVAAALPPAASARLVTSAPAR